jgi:hypothetical protein
MPGRGFLSWHVLRGFSQSLQTNSRDNVIKEIPASFGDLFHAFHAFRFLFNYVSSTAQDVKWHGCAWRSVGDHKMSVRAPISEHRFETRIYWIQSRSARHLIMTLISDISIINLLRIIIIIRKLTATKTVKVLKGLRTFYVALEATMTSG